MRLATFAPTADAAPRIGALLDDDQVLEVRAAAIHHGQGTTPFPHTLLELLSDAPSLRAARATIEAAQHASADLRVAGLIHRAADVVWLPPIPRPGKIVCLGRNYREHAAEMGAEVLPYPVLFAKFSNTLLGHQQPLQLPAASDKVDYEAELMLVIGRTAKDVPPEHALEYVAGYTVFNDVSVRDWQRRTNEWLQGKSFDHTGPCGPVIVTADAISDPHNLDVTLRLNGTVMQQGNTSQFIFDIPAMLAYITTIMTLEPGDLIATGTPSGVGASRNPPVFLQAGDLVEITIAEVGTLITPVVAAQGT